MKTKNNSVEHLLLVDVISDLDGLVVVANTSASFQDFRNNEKDVEPSFSLVHFAVPRILAGDLVEMLDSRVGPPDLKEAEALKILAYTAICCVKRKRTHRPTMNDIVVNLDRAFDLVCQLVVFIA